MERTLPLRTDGSAAASRGAGWFWGLPLLGLLAWHGWMTFTLFGSENRWQQLLDERPIVSGRHPFHLYHATLGAQSLRERGTFCCFDPAFQAGYPKTPVFDEGARPGELFLTLGGGGFCPAAYKIGLAICCLLAPLLLLAAARGVGLRAGACTVAMAATILVCWGTPGRQLLEAGDLDLYVAGLAVVTGAGMLIFFHRSPGFRSWLGLFVAGCLGWFMQPLLFITLFPLALIYYTSVGAKHRLAWHVALLCALGGAFAVNCLWLFDWLSYWWIRLPLQGLAPMLAHRTIHTLCTAPLWGEPCERLFAGVLLILAVAGLYAFNETRQRPAARLFGVGTIGFSALALAGAAWEPFARIGTSRLLIVALWFAVVPAGYGLTAVAPYALRLMRRPLAAIVLATFAPAALYFLTGKSLAGFALRYVASTPLSIGLTPQQLGWVRAIQENTTAEARILWEEDPDDGAGSRWTALLPLLTPERYYLGGLDPNASIEHAYASLCKHCLAGRPLENWSETELSDFYRRYNIGWIVCRSQAALACLQNYQDAQPVLFVQEKNPRYLFQLKTRSYVLQGQARLLEADTRHIVLADVVPEDGKVVLSMHYQEGMRVFPARVQIEKESDPHDPIDFIRLRLQGPVARVTITWQPGK